LQITTEACAGKTKIKSTRLRGDSCSKKAKNKIINSRTYISEIFYKKAEQFFQQQNVPVFR